MKFTVELQNERTILESDYKHDLVSRAYSHLAVLKDGERIWLGYGHGEAERETGSIADLCERTTEWRAHLESMGVEGRELNEPEVWLRGYLAGGHSMSESHLDFFRAGKVHPVCG
jgi:hypothetical protein